jgi:hypothetical protein
VGSRTWHIPTAFAFRLSRGLTRFFRGAVETAVKVTWSDDARRFADAITLHSVAGSAGKWAVITLADGRPKDLVAYDSRPDAVRSTRWDRDRYLYIFIPPDGMHPREAQACLNYGRMLHDAGFRLPDPDDRIQPDVIGWDTMPTLPQDRKRQIRLLTK